MASSARRVCRQTIALSLRERGIFDASRARGHDHPGALRTVGRAHRCRAAVPADIRSMWQVVRRFASELENFHSAGRMQHSGVPGPVQH